MWPKDTGTLLPLIFLPPVLFLVFVVSVFAFACRHGRLQRPHLPVPFCPDAIDLALVDGFCASINPLAWLTTCAKLSASSRSVAQEAQAAVNRLNVFLSTHSLAEVTTLKANKLPSAVSVRPDFKTHVKMRAIFVGPEV